MTGGKHKRPADFNSLGEFQGLMGLPLMDNFLLTQGTLTASAIISSGADSSDALTSAMNSFFVNKRRMPSQSDVDKYTMLSVYPFPQFHFDNYHPRCICDCHGSGGFDLGDQAAQS